MNSHSWFTQLPAKLRRKTNMSIPLFITHNNYRKKYSEMRSAGTTTTSTTTTFLGVASRFPQFDSPMRHNATNVGCSFLERLSFPIFSNKRYSYGNAHDVRTLTFTTTVVPNNYLLWNTSYDKKTVILFRNCNRDAHDKVSMLCAYNILA